jgi:FkbM family methyltransferase
VCDSVIRVTGKGEHEVERTFLGLLSPGDVVYDIGANIGWYSLLAARAVGPAGRVFAFEPSVSNAFYAQSNARRNGFPNITVVPAALTDEDGWLSFLLNGSLEGRLAKDDTERQAQRRARRGQPSLEREFVAAATLDRWLAQTGETPPTVVKIDVEGAEVGVLRGMRSTISTSRPALIVELHGTREEVADELDNLGYAHRAIESGTPTREAPWWAHVLATPR